MLKVFKDTLNHDHSWHGDRGEKIISWDMMMVEGMSLMHIYPYDNYNILKMTSSIFGYNQQE